MKATEIDSVLVKDVMSTPRMTVSKGETVSDVISRMKKGRVREIPVLENSKPLGLVSYYSLLSRRNLPLSAKVEHIMVPCPRLEEDMTIISAAEELMSTGVRGAPVVRNSKLVGFVSRTDIIRIISNMDTLRRRQVGTIMSRAPVSVSKNEPVRKAQILMKGLNEKTLPVVDEKGGLIGAIGMTEIMDVVWAPRASKPPNEVRGDREPADVRVESVMNRYPAHVAPDDTLDKATSVMLSKNLSTVFVAEEGKLVGVISQTDIMEQVISLRPREGVYVQITGLDVEDPEVYEVMYDLIGRSMKKIDKIQSPKVFSVHVTAYHQDGLKNKYSLGARLTTEKGTYYSKGSDWHLYRSLDAVLDLLEKSIRKDHEKQLAARRRKQNLK
ncbi:MAG: CBS domain-containing protein [Methanobacteriota archaeon]|nr:MAG: CBS domain-containing protein [Euryarchaeota archaeon]